MTTAKSEEAAATRPGLLSGKVCVVSGVGPGLGRQAAKALAAHGADLVLAARRQSSLDEVLAEVSSLGARAVAVPTDITDPDACARLMAAGLHAEISQLRNELESTRAVAARLAGLRRGRVTGADLVPVRQDHKRDDT